MLPGQADQVRIIKWVGPLLLSPGELNRLPTGIPGVYLLHLFSDAHGGYPIFYVGQARDLKRRLSEHASDRKAKVVIAAMRRLGESYFSAAPIANADELDRVESALIAALSPPCNYQRPSAPPLFVNLPPIFSARHHH